MKILFFTPYGGLSGSELVLFYLLRNLDKKSYQASLFSRHRGELFNQMPDTIPAYSFRPATARWERLRERVGRRFRTTSLYEDQIVELHRRVQPDAWYINTILMPELTPLAQKLNVPYILHVHELPMVYGSVAKEELRHLLESASLVMGGSQIVINTLALMGVKSLELQYDCIDLERIKASGKELELRRSLGIPNDAFLWGMGGLLEYRKGVDLFLEVAKVLRRDDTHFLWIGGQLDNGFPLFIEKSVEFHGLKNIHFVGKQTDGYYNHLSCLDGFLLTSREDPFPLVMIDAAALRKPIVSFNSGGVKEFIQPGMGTVVDSWNLPDLVEAMLKVMNGETFLDANISRKRAEDFDVSVQVKHWEALLQKHVSSLLHQQHHESSRA